MNNSSEVENELGAHMEDKSPNWNRVALFYLINLQYFDKSDGSKFASVMSIKCSFYFSKKSYHSCGTREDLKKKKTTLWRI